MAAVGEEVVGRGEEDSHVGFEGETTEQVGEALLDFGRTLGEELLELVDDDDGPVVLVAPAFDGGDGSGGLFEADQVAHSIGVPGQLLCELHGEGLGEGGEGTNARSGDEHPPAGGRGREDPSSEKRRLAGAGGADQTEEMETPQLLPQRFDFELARREDRRGPARGPCRRECRRRCQPPERRLAPLPIPFLGAALARCRNPSPRRGRPGSA